MKKQLFSLTLWMFFGFVCITSINAIITLIIQGYLYVGLYFHFSVEFLTLSIYSLSFIFYAIVSFFIINFLKCKIKDFKLNEINFPKNLYIILISFSIIMSPLGNKFTGLFYEKLASISNYGIEELLSLYGTTQTSIAISQWLTAIILSIYFYRIHRKNEIKTEQ